MCNPVAIGIIGLMIAAGGTAYQVQQQRQQAAQQREYQGKLEKEGKKAAKDAYDSQVGQEITHQSQEDLALAQNLQESQKRSEQAQATARVASGEAGVSGLSVDQLLGDYQRQESVYNMAAKQNRDFEKRQGEMNLLGYAAGRDSRYAQYTYAPVHSPSYAGAGIRIGGDAMSSYSTYYDRTNRASEST